VKFCKVENLQLTNILSRTHTETRMTDGSIISGFCRDPAYNLGKLRKFTVTERSSGRTCRYGVAETIMKSAQDALAFKSLGQRKRKNETRIKFTSAVAKRNGAVMSPSST
jgi:hypothetical protein